MYPIYTYIYINNYILYSIYWDTAVSRPSFAWYQSLTTKSVGQKKLAEKTASRTWSTDALAHYPFIDIYSCAKNQ